MNFTEEELEQVKKDLAHLTACESAAYNDYLNIKDRRDDYCKQFSSQIAEITKIEFNKRRILLDIETKNKKSRATMLLETLKVGDYVVVKTNTGNKVKQILNVNGDKMFSYGVNCATHVKPKYKINTNKKYVEVSNPNEIVVRTDLYSYNSVIGKLMVDEQPLRVERFKT